MKILHTADWHIGSFRSPMKDGVNLRTEDIKRCLDELVRVATLEQPDYCLIAGDVFHVGRLWSDRCCEELLTAIFYIKKLAAVSKQVIVMRGTPNHDGAGQFRVLAEAFVDTPNVQVVLTPQVLSFADVDFAVLPGIDRGVFRAAHPELSSEEEQVMLTAALSELVMDLKGQCMSGKKHVLMAHDTVEGCRAENGQTMMLNQFEPVLLQETLEQAKYDLIALGHIHRPQKIRPHAWYYAGAIHAFNFNDEGQERGFWIHHWQDSDWQSLFYQTPSRAFLTLNLTDADVVDFNTGHLNEMAFRCWRCTDALRDKIVRVRYRCLPENRKALNQAVLEKALLADGAFMVWEILPEQTAEPINRNTLAVATDAEKNLSTYLEEKQLSPEKIQELVWKAKPVIAQAEEQMTTTAHTGIFEPVELAVKNYRNYAQETFCFSDITFCTINGQNGAGKSSLFMDAILDCLYEEPREGMVKDENGKAFWLRNEEHVRSGFIKFTFRMGEKQYRVTRTRTRSGKGTLQISQWIDGAWKDCSKERYKDTQQEILNIVGMDSFTFKSCALIMQDQYGLFLQAKPEERMEVLGTLLGLGVYQAMERLAWEKAKEHNGKSRAFQQELTICHTAIRDFGDPQKELELCTQVLAEQERILQEKTAQSEQKKWMLAQQQEAEKRRKKALADIATWRKKQADLEKKRIEQQALIDQCAQLLGARTEIEAHVEKRAMLLRRERALLEQVTRYTSKKEEVKRFKKQEETEQKQIQKYKKTLTQKQKELALAQPRQQDCIVKEKAEEYVKKKASLDLLQEKALAYEKLERAYTMAVFQQNECERVFAAKWQAEEEKKQVLEKKVRILKESGCVDAARARCKFLQDAVEAKEQLLAQAAVFDELARCRAHELENAKRAVAEALEKKQAAAFDASAWEVLQAECAALFPYVSQMEAIKERETRSALLEAERKHLQEMCSAAEDRLAESQAKRVQAQAACDCYKKAFVEHEQVVRAIQELEIWAEKEKQLPVAKERAATAQTRVQELAEELRELAQELAERETEADRELLAVSGMEESTALVQRLEREVQENSRMVKETQMRIGALQQKIEQIAQLKQEILELQDKQREAAKEAADYEILKAAFSQSGVPHQIIRSVIPQLTETANAILGQMTGGKMGAEFRLERFLKNGKEKGSLDIFIEEYGKSVLPYLSKSGGEKVKSSLSVILALAELKASSAGIQLGMLFIDEPPFLDEDGMQAYCDALETIQNRYKTMKIMAITHDPAMKARFPQNIEVVKTEHGSRIAFQMNM